MRRAYKLDLPEAVCSEIFEFAKFTPTLSAKALTKHLETHPWLKDMLIEFPGAPPCHIILFPNLGFQGCHKCDTCPTARLHQIRLRYQPNLDDELDSDLEY